MSSMHRIIVARNEWTGETVFPLGDLTLYGTDEEADNKLLQGCRSTFGPEWSLAIYEPKSSFYSGTNV